MRHKTIPNFLSKEECDTIIGLARNRLGPSTGWDVLTGQPTITDYRKSEHCFLQVMENDFVLGIEQRIAKVTGFPVENGEGLQIAHYNVGGYYKPHWDYFDPAHSGNQSVINRGGQRLVTFMVYLCEVEEGGETYFPNIPLNVIPETGKAFMWFNVTRLPSKHEVSNGISPPIDTSTYHEAKPVLKGEKWALNKWLRAGVFT